MAEPLTTMFGKAYDTVGSADKNLILLTRGDLKVKWGGKYIDLIKNGKINVDVELLKKVDSKESIYKDGVYLIEKEDKQEVWVSIGGTLVNLLGEAGTSYVSFLEKLDVKVELKAIALSNIGLYYETLEDAQNAKILKGLIYTLDSNKIYYVKDGALIEYKLDFSIPDPLTIGNIVIDGTSSTIKGSPLSFNYGDVNYISFNDKGINFSENAITKKDILSEDYLQGLTGYAIFHNTEDNQTYLEIDVIRIRSDLEYTNVINVTYKELKSLYTSGKLVKGKKYCITDFQNEWELQERYNRHNSLTTFNYYWPIVLTADTKRTFKKEGYFRDNENWIIEYDINFNYYSHTEIGDNGETLQIYSKGRITKLTDEFGNVGNFDFKHRIFKYTSSSDDHRQWYYTYNIQNELYNTAGTDDDLDYDDYLNTHVNRDASLLGLIENNTFYIKEPSCEDGVDNLGHSCKKLVLYDDCIIFPDCSTILPYGNKIYGSTGKFIITGNFYNNTFLGLYDTSNQEVQFTLDFNDNTFLEVRESTLNVLMQYNTFDLNVTLLNIQNATISNCLFKGLINNASISGNLTKCQFEGLSDGIVIAGPLDNMTILSDITPSSANYVQDADIPSRYTEILQLSISLQVVPRLAENLHKDCAVVNKNGMLIFLVLLLTDDNTPSGVILMWSGDVNNIPSGYVICDGNNGTPNLVDRFIKASASTVGPIDNDDTEVVNNVKTNKIKLSTNNLPKHTHSISTSNLSVLSASTSVVTSGNNVTINFEQGNTEYTANNYNTSNQDHSHSISGDISCGDGNFANTPFNIEPLAYALIFIMKL